MSKPKTNWADLEKSPGDGGGEYSKEALKDLIEARRHNDMVRKREFEYLRKIRQQSGHDEVGVEINPSMLQTHVPLESGGRAQTLKKIDAIEEEMSRHWWRKKPGGGTSAGTVQVAQRVLSQHPVDTPPHFQKTEIMLVASDLAAVTSVASDKRIYAVAEAFGLGDDVGAELLLLLLLGQEDGEQDMEVWLTLLDLYRATGQSDVFESRALEFVNRFGRSAPSWQNWTQGHTGECVQQGYTLAGSIGGVDRPWAQDWVAPEPGPLPWEIDCYDLLRMDMAAARDLVGWCQLQQQAGYRIHLLEVNRLVAALLLSLDIGNCLRLVLRND